MTGHATPEDNALIQALESSVDYELSPTDDLLRLAQLYICPAHTDDKAIEVLRVILRRDPGNVWASYYFAECCLYYLMTPEALTEAKRILKAAIEAHPTECGALLMQLSNIQCEQQTYSGSKKTDVKESISLLEDSVELEPNWVANRVALAHVLRKAGMEREAILHLRKAQQNCIDLKNTDMNINDQDFESQVTGRTSSFYQEQIPKTLMQISRQKSFLTLVATYRLLISFVLTMVPIMLADSGKRDNSLLSVLLFTTFGSATTMITYALIRQRTRLITVAAKIDMVGMLLLVLYGAIYSNWWAIIVVWPLALVWFLILNSLRKNDAL